MVAIKNDIEAGLVYVKSRNERCVQPLTEMIFNKIHEQRESGWDISYLATLLSDSTEAIFKLAEDPILDHELVWFHLFRTNTDGSAIEPVAFLVIDLTDGEVFDCSENIVTRH